MKNSDFPFNQSPTKPKTKNQIADEMGINPKTLTRHLDKAGLFVPRGLIFPEKQAEIYKRLGWENDLS